ncbi:MAG: APC family permease [Methanoregula sp.]|jgi:putative glutamate/gamma-aminobutyrate antiporter
MSQEAKPQTTTPAPTKAISWITMALLTTCAVASIRGLPAMAPYGLASILLYLVPAIVFLIPTALIAAELASSWEGGVFGWVKAAYGDRAGFFAIWQQWIQNVVWFPAQLAFFATALAYIFDRNLANNGLFIGIVILVVFWISTLIAFRGVAAFSAIGSKGMIIGTLIPVFVLVILAILFVTTGGHSDMPTNAASDWIPSLAGVAGIVLIISNFLSYAGMEMNAVHVTDMKNPAKEFPKSILLASLLILIIFIPGTLAISIALPSANIGLTTGVMQAMDVFFNQFGIPYGVNILSALIVIGILASVVTWIPGPSRGLLMVGQAGYLPPWFQKTNAAGMQVNIMIVQGIIVSILAIFFASLPSVSSAFWILSAMAVQLYLIMYVLMFMSAMRLRKIAPDIKRGFRVPCITLVGIIGVIASVAAFAIGFVEPTGMGMHQGIYSLILIVGIIVLGIWPLIIYHFRKPEWNLNKS